MNLSKSKFERVPLRTPPRKKEETKRKEKRTQIYFQV